MKKINNTLYYLVAAGLFIVPFIPFIVSSSMFFPFITGKGFTFRIVTEIVFGLYILLAFLDSNYRPKDSYITRSIFLFSFVILITNLFSQNPYKSFWSNYERMEGFVTIIHLLMYYLSLSSVFDFRMWYRYLNTTLVASGLLSIYGIFQVLGKIRINQGGLRIDATFGNSTYFAIYLVFHIFISVYLLLRNDNKKWQKYLYSSLIILEIITLYFTATRGAVLGIIGGLFLSGVYILWMERGNKFYRKVSLILLGSIFLLVSGFYLIKDTKFVNDNFILSRFSTLSFSEIKTQGRYFVWPMAVKGFIERPILGWGQESFNYVFNKNYDPRMFGQEEWFDRTHNIFLDWLIAGGLLGLLSYLSIYIAFLYYILRKENKLSVIERGVFVGLISAYLFHNIFVFDNLISYIMFFTILSYIHSINVYDKKTFLTEKNVSADGFKYVVFPMVLVSITLVIYFINVPAIQANKTLIKAISPSSDSSKNLELFKKAYSYNSFAFDEITEQLVQAASNNYSASNVPPNVKSEFIDFAISKLTEKISSAPNDARYLVFAGSFLNHLGRYDEALVYLNRALEASPKKQSIFFEIGSSYIGKGDTNKMFEIFKQAYELKPDAQESMKIYAIGAIYSRNSKVLTELLTKIDQNILFYDNRFLRAYSDIGEFNTVITILNKRLSDNPKDVQTKLTLASVYVTIGQKQKAIDLLTQIANENPQFKDQVEDYIKQIKSQ